MLKGTHVVVGTPAYLARAAVSGNLRLHNLRALAVVESVERIEESQN